MSRIINPIAKALILFLVWTNDGISRLGLGLETNFCKSWSQRYQVLPWSKPQLS